LPGCSPSSSACSCLSVAGSLSAKYDSTVLYLHTYIPHSHHHHLFPLLPPPSVHSSVHLLLYLFLYSLVHQAKRRDKRRAGLFWSIHLHLHTCSIRRPSLFLLFFFFLQSHLSRLELDRLLQSTLVVDPSRCACYITLGKPRHFSNGSPSCLHHIFPLCSALSCPLSHNFFSWPDSLLLSTTTTTTLHPIVRVSFAKHRNDCRSLLHSLASSRHSP
jgi:hypothetical protein